jgi:hypothetical protein
VPHSEKKKGQGEKGDNGGGKNGYYKGCGKCEYGKGGYYYKGGGKNGYYKGGGKGVSGKGKGLSGNR